MDARETEVAGHFLLGLSSVPARCVFVVLLCFCVCVCVSKSVIFFFDDFSTQQGAYGQLDGVGHRRPIQIAVKMSLLHDMVMKQCLILNFGVFVLTSCSLHSFH